MDIRNGDSKSFNVPIYQIVGFERRNGLDSQELKIETFDRPPGTSAQSIIGTKNYPDVGILLSFADNEYSQGKAQIKEAFK